MTNDTKPPLRHIEQEATAGRSAASGKKPLQLETRILSEEKASRVCVEMGSHLLTKQFWLFPCEGRIAQ